MAPQHLGDDAPFHDAAMDLPTASRENVVAGPARARKKFVLCFDGTGNKFQGNDGDSNILKIFRMLDRQTDQQFHYYQPGIGTYVTSNDYTHTSVFSRMNSWYQKAKDSAVGTSFDAHVMGGYKFLMRYYSPGDDIFFFGFSRGAYIARFLAEMLDYVGLLSAGNEELARFAWKTFSQWQQRLGGTEEEQKKKKDMYRFMKAFRETFSRPVRRIRFLGLFDTVNSVPRFESAWMERSKFPYTARSSAKVIRHAVGIDERRAKFRQDLISGDPPKPAKQQRKDVGRRLSVWIKSTEKAIENDVRAPFEHSDTAAAKEDELARYKVSRPRKKTEEPARAGRPVKLDTDRVSLRYRPTSRRSRSHSRVPSAEARSISNDSQISFEHYDSDTESEDDGPQDIEEVWFPGCHADIGGGWNLAEGEEFPLSHVPLIWMVREAQNAGLGFDYEKMKNLNCWDDEEDFTGPANPGGFSSFTFPPASAPQQPIPKFQISGVDDDDDDANGPAGGTNTASTTAASAAKTDPTITTHTNANDSSPPNPSEFHRALEYAASKGMMHDCLAFNNGLPAGSVISWRIMEYLPFRRMDLQEDGSWKPIRWPLPGGETRDIPRGAKIHNSAIRRMHADPAYRPGNLIVGGGGRGVKVAPAEYGIGEWITLREKGDAVGEVFVRKDHHDSIAFQNSTGH